ncbi:hypothetical protein ABFS82_03G104800 [Erythranthe guttata]|uniref:uncharacterized protein LOC105974423 n=1 Tax=Erythranthe guttata TaxID=4155 RepID=UPI00064E0620|nr:PREDICTED: uncharacterized protein LOC105974423 [Erythranthe guttata]|eukprot:XP_012854978.1 PREDICTED: uncharacterized protein LOC105974423 [Erythranthe guttata]
MDRTEPTLVPEWLRSTGNIVGGSGSVHHSDVSSSAHSIRSRVLRGSSEKDSPRYLNRSSSSSSSNPRHSSTSNGSGKHPYSSFSRSHWDKNRDREKEKTFSEELWNHNSSDPLASLLTSRVERGALRRSQSLVSRKPAEPLSHRVENSRISGNGVVSRGSNLNVSQKAVFEKDFPSLRTEEKQCATGIRRVSSPGLSSAVQCLPIGNTGFLGGEKWTSALAEVPDILANNGISHSPLQQGVVPSSNSSLGISSSAGLNMAEALSQPVARVHPSSQLSDKSQRLEELAIKQSRQLIPMTSSMPKALVPSADKSKQPKIVTRANETTVASRGIHPQPHASHLANQPRAGQIRSDSANTSHVGKFLVLKPGRESVTHGDNANGEVTNDGQLATAPLAPTGSISLSNSVVSALENKTAALSLSSRSTTEKRSLQSLAQSRSEFFKLMRRKTSPCATTTVHSGSSSADLSPSADTSGENCNGKQMNCNGERCEIPEKNRSSSDAGEKSFSVNGSVYPDEEEAAFLRSLGWEENGGEDEGLTEEEINAFYQEYMSRRPS